MTDDLSFVCPECKHQIKYAAGMTMGEVLSLRHNNQNQAVKLEALKMEINAKAARIAELEAVLKAGVSLALNVRGSWDAFEPLLRREIGNTNYHCVEEKSVEFLSAARAALEHKE